MYTIIILFIVLYGLDIWSHTLNQEPRLRLFEQRVLSRTLVPMMEKVTGGCRKLCNEELNVIRMKCYSMRYVGHVACMGEKRDAYGKVIDRRPQKILWDPRF